MGLRVIVLLTVGITVWSANADLYWHAFEAKDGKLPEESGWTRNFSYGGAQRSFSDGVLRYDSLNDIRIDDLNEIQRPGQIDPKGPSERFVMEWRLKVDKVIGTYDPGVGLGSDHSWLVGFAFAEDRAYSMFENFASVPFAAGVFHDYRLESSDMRTYTLYIDGEPARGGQFSQRISRSYIKWGDSVQGGASLHEWAWLRFGVVPVPEPPALLPFGFAMCALARHRGGPFR